MDRHLQSPQHCPAIEVATFSHRSVAVRPLPVRPHGVASHRWPLQLDSIQSIAYLWPVYVLERTETSRWLRENRLIVICCLLWLYRCWWYILVKIVRRFHWSSTHPRAVPLRVNGVSKLNVSTSWFCSNSFWRSSNSSLQKYGVTWVIWRYANFGSSVLTSIWEPKSKWISSKMFIFVLWWFEGIFAQDNFLVSKFGLNNFFFK